MKYMISCWFCGSSPIFARHKQVRPAWLPDVLATAGPVPLCADCHRLVVAEQWLQLVDRVATVRDRATGRGYHTCGYEASDRLVSFLASDAGEFEIVADW